MALCRLVGVQLIGEALAHHLPIICSCSSRVPWQCMLQAMLTASALLVAGTYILIALLFGFLKGELHQGEGNAASTTAAVLQGAGEAVMSLRWTESGAVCSPNPTSFLQATHLHDVIKYTAAVIKPACSVFPVAAAAAVFTAILPENPT